MMILHETIGEIDRIMPFNSSSCCTNKTADMNRSKSRVEQYADFGPPEQCHMILFANQATPEAYQAHQI